MKLVNVPRLSSYLPQLYEELDATLRTQTYVCIFETANILYIEPYQYTHTYKYLYTDMNGDRRQMSIAELLMDVFSLFLAVSYIQSSFSCKTRIPLSVSIVEERPRSSLFSSNGIEYICMGNSIKSGIIFGRIYFRK